MFCCYCGFIGHEQKSCIKQTKDMENGIFVMDSQNGNWLRASPGKSAGWKKYGPGGNRWSPGKSGNSKPDDHGGIRGVGPYCNPDMVKRLGAGDLNSVYSRAQIGDTGEDGMLLPNNPQKILLSLPSSASAGILKPKSLNSILGDESSGLSKGIGPPLFDNGTKNPAQITSPLLKSPITAPLLKSPKTVPLLKKPNPL